jgi:hypothetical protein
MSLIMVQYCFSTVLAIVRNWSTFFKRASTSLHYCIIMYIHVLIMYSSAILYDVQFVTCNYIILYNVDRTLDFN